MDAINVKANVKANAKVPPSKPDGQGVPRLFLLSVAAFVVTCFATLKGDWSGLFSIESLRKMIGLFGEFFPPEMSASFLQKVALGFCETLAISVIGTLLAIVLALLLARPAAAQGPRRAMARLLLNGLRAVPELVWAALLVIAAGLGPFPGTLALALHTAGVLGRLFADAFENAPPEPALALTRNGASATNAFWYGTLPTVLPQLVSYTLYRWENNIRAAAVLGVVGGGGLGQLLYYHLALFHFSDAGTVLISMLILVALVDWLSDRLRRSMTA
jgi:phosphonate transport system permease protein